MRTTPSTPLAGQTGTPTQRRKHLRIMLWLSPILTVGFVGIAYFARNWGFALIGAIWLYLTFAYYRRRGEPNPQMDPSDVLSDLLVTAEVLLPKEGIIRSHATVTSLSRLAEHHLWAQLTEDGLWLAGNLGFLEKDATNGPTAIEIEAEDIKSIEEVGAWSAFRVTLQDKKFDMGILYATEWRNALRRHPKLKDKFTSPW